MELNSYSNPAVPVPLLDVNRGNKPLLDPIMDALREICETGRFIGGKYCQELESAVAGYCDAEFAIGCASGSDALLLALMAIDLQPGEEVIIPSFTFFATASAITRLGGRPVFVDIDPQTYNMDPARIEALITDQTRAILPVHLFGQCANMKAIKEIADQHRLTVIEDAAQAIGASIDGKMAGGIGDMGCISFYPTKNLGGFGDGGMVTTNDPALAKRIRLLANHGMEPRYYHSEVGINSRLDSMQAAVLGIKIKQLNQFSAMRSQNAATYRRLIASSGLSSVCELPFEDQRCSHVWNQFTIRIPGGRRDAVRESLAQQKIGTEIYYPVPIHEQECFAWLDQKPGSLPETEKAAGEVLSLPIFPELTKQEIESVVNGLAKALLGARELSGRELRRAA